MRFETKQHCMNCFSTRKDQLKQGYYKGVDICYCSNKCFNEILPVINNKKEKQIHQKTHSFLVVNGVL